jgi:MYXO-CTERM domain-containing protein
MSTNPRFERFLERIDPSRREALRKILAGTVLYSAPLIASFSMQSLEGVAQAQSRNQTQVQAVPTSSGWTLTAMAAAIGAAATLLLRRRRDR